ncbi:MAG: HEAT repeat domain-containing protein [Proteobacteria bacterium]|nr:HEAT repeat domain-containing protein [Pseudomonadota bacterium]
MRRTLLILGLICLLPATGTAQRDLVFEDELAWAGLVPSDFAASWRDTVNRNPKAPGDPWRTLASEQLLGATPLLAAVMAEGAAAQLSVSGGGPMAGLSWERHFVEAATQLKIDGAGADCVPPAASTLVEQSVAHEASTGLRRSKREVRELNESIDGRLNAAIGTLMGAAASSSCQLEAAFAQWDDERRAAVVATVEAAITGIPAGTSEADDAASTLASAWTDTDRAALLAAGAAWSSSLTAAALELSTLPPEAWPRQPTIFPTEFGEVWIGSPASNSGTGDPFLIVDPGGDDQWRVFPDATAFREGGARAVRGWIDLGGDDLWQTGDGGVGGALMSVSAGLDLAGDDTWRGGRLTAGAAAFGTSTWLDVSGRDIYDGGAGSQGFALFGTAALRDLGSDGDTYRSVGPSQAAAFPAALAVLHDAGGSDTMEVGAGGGQGLSVGWFPRLGGGFAFLLDEAGDDRRTTAGGGQGGCVGGGVAAAADLAGDDVWTSSSPHAQASAREQCVAVLLDRQGNDRYAAPEFAQGWAEDRAVAMLSDTAGDDRYDVGQTGQGHGGWGSAAILRDAQGQDTYVASGGRGAGGVALGLRIDDDGNASYLDAAPQRTGGGLGYSNLGAPTSDEEAVALIVEHATSPSAAASALTKGGPGMLTAALGRVSDFRPAETAVVHIYIVTGAGARTPEERKTLAETLAEDALARPADRSDGSVRWHLIWLADAQRKEPLAVEAALRAATGLASHPNGRVRAEVLDLYRAVADHPELTVSPEDLTDWGSKAAVALQSDSSPEVRWAAMDLLEAIGGAGVASIVAGSLASGDAAMRNRAETALRGLIDRIDGLAVARALFPLTEEGSLPVRAAALRLIGATGHKEAWDVLEPALADSDPRIRLAAVVGSTELLPNRKVEAALQSRRDLEDEPRVHSRLPGETR